MWEFEYQFAKTPEKNNKKNVFVVFMSWEHSAKKEIVSIVASEGKAQDVITDTMIEYMPNYPSNEKESAGGYVEFPLMWYEKKEVK